VRFVLVNGRTPCSRTFCMLCCEAIGNGYLREIGTQLPYCDYKCYSLYREYTALVHENRERAASRAAAS
jgi:hypothetical protein